MPEFDFIGVVVAAVIAGVISFSLVMLRKVSEINERTILTKNDLARIDTISERMNKIAEIIEQLKSDLRMISYRIKELEKEKRRTDDL